MRLCLNLHCICKIDIVTNSFILNIFVVFSGFRPICHFQSTQYPWKRETSLGCTKESLYCVTVYRWKAEKGDASLEQDYLRLALHQTWLLQVKAREQIGVQEVIRFTDLNPPRLYLGLVFPPGKSRVPCVFFELEFLTIPIFVSDVGAQRKSLRFRWDFHKNVSFAEFLFWCSKESWYLPALMSRLIWFVKTSERYPELGYEPLCQFRSCFFCG